MKHIKSAIGIILLLVIALPAGAQDCSGKRDTAPGPGLHRVLFETQKLIDQKKLSQAAKALAEYAKENPDQDHYLLPFTRGVLAYQLKQRSQAERFFTRTTKLNPCYGPAWRNLAVVLFEGGRTTQAAEFMLQAYSVSKPPDDNIKYEAAALFLAADKPARALTLLKELAKLPKPKKSWLKALVQAYLVLKQPAKAEPVLKRLLKIQPGDATLWKLLAVVSQEKEDTASAAAALMSATITRAPSAANFRAIPAPKPDPAPVTIAVLPSSLMAGPPVLHPAGWGHENKPFLIRLQHLALQARAMLLQRGQIQRRAIQPERFDAAPLPDQDRKRGFRGRDRTADGPGMRLDAGLAQRRDANRSHGDGGIESERHDRTTKTRQP